MFYCSIIKNIKNDKSNLSIISMKLILFVFIIYYKYIVNKMEFVPNLPLIPLDSPNFIKDPPFYIMDNKIYVDVNNNVINYNIPQQERWGWGHWGHRNGVDLWDHTVPLILDNRTNLTPPNCYSSKEMGDIFYLKNTGITCIFFLKSLWEYLWLKEGYKNDQEISMMTLENYTIINIKLNNILKNNKITMVSDTQFIITEIAKTGYVLSKTKFDQLLDDTISFRKNNSPIFTAYKNYWKARRMRESAAEALAAQEDLLRNNIAMGIIVPLQSLRNGRVIEKSPTKKRKLT
jgi:hypothetical protein